MQNTDGRRVRASRASPFATGARLARRAEYYDGSPRRRRAPKDASLVSFRLFCFAGLNVRAKGHEAAHPSRRGRCVCEWRTLLPGKTGHY